MVATSSELRVLDFGSVSPLRSQTLWHALAYGVDGGAPATVAFCRSTGPYVSVGYHRSLDEVDLGWCRRRGLPVYRRMVGGGPVYVDQEQLLFQLVLARELLSPSRTEAVRRVLDWAVPAFVAAGLDAALDEHGEISVGDRKVCGHGAAEIGRAVAVVGNVLGRFDHHEATAILAIADPARRVEVEQAMRRYVGAGEATIDADAFKVVAVGSFARHLDLDPRPGSLTPAERVRVAALDEQFESDSWRVGTGRTGPCALDVKIRAGVHVTDAGPKIDERFEATAPPGRMRPTAPPGRMQSTGPGHTLTASAGAVTIDDAADPRREPAQQCPVVAAAQTSAGIVTGASGSDGVDADSASALASGSSGGVPCRL